MGISYVSIKSLIDRLVAFILIILLSPLLLLCFCLSAVFQGFPVFFCQSRIGFKNQAFILIKFRTMSNHYTIVRSTSINNDYSRITRLGRIYRMLSIDELPELFNIFKGDMSFVGPRPLLPEYLPLYDAKQIRRHNVIPGLTGLAQVNGRNKLSWTKKFAFDTYYVDHQNLFLDLFILAKTVITIFSFATVNSSSTHIMKPFTGMKEIN